ncbi:F-box protein PP2-B11-like [Rhododendron vialii]|uniref:F-box protein PP2-B11-like n=1 Tax=Rhododendron vialii TaxID=182163 RepID=UPI00265D7ECF|nr:F-box protein PP2-B11-like [Rhododendron vialii]
MGIWEGLLPVVFVVVSVIGAIRQPIVEDVVHRSVDALYGFVSRELRRLWRLALQKKPQAVLLDQGRASLTIDEDEKRCYMIGARGLKIGNGKFQAHWTWAPHPCTRVLEVAELVSVWWLGFRLRNFRAKMNLEMLSPSTTYVVYLVFKIARDSRGLSGPATAAIRTWESAVKTKGPRCTVFFMNGDHETEEYHAPQERSDGWMEIRLGEFFVNRENYRVLCLKFKLVEDKDIEKKGLIIQGIEFRPKQYM